MTPKKKKRLRKRIADANFKLKKKFKDKAKKIPGGAITKYSFKTLSLAVGIISVAAAIIINFDKFVKP